MHNPQPAERAAPGLHPFRRSLPALAALLAAALLAACSSAVTVPAVRTAPPEAPVVHTWPVEGEIHLDWDPIPGAASYTLYWSSSPDVASNKDNTVADIKATRYIHKGLKNGRAYYYYLVALDRAGKELRGFAPIGDIPYKYEVRSYRNFLAVVPRPHDTWDTLAEQYLKDRDKGWIIREFNDQRTPTPFRAVMIPRKPYEPGGLTDKGYRMVPILAYHQITRTRPTKMAVLQTDFELQMAYLKRNRYQVITLDQLVDFLEFKGQVPERAVVITFDDGWASTYTIALPILQKYGYPATLFVTMNLIGADKKALNWKQVKELEKSGVIDVQCHTRTHPDLSDPGDRDLKAYLAFLNDEVVASRDVLKKQIGKTCKYLAYPYGATNHLVVAIAQKAGYRAAFTVERGSNPFFVTDYRVLRSMIYGEFDLKQFAENLDSFSNRVLK
jgi:peptidoglycan/xylan/chitin deacetylase (PgdA/CDA1 family)